jgi:RNA polymerase sigma-70 factor (ECF subfamily)
MAAMDPRRELNGRADPMAQRAVDAARRRAPTELPAQRSAPEDQSWLITAAQSGDEWAFRQLYRTFQPGLLLYLRGLVGDEAEDVASEAWGQIARDLASFTGDGPAFRAWSATIARHRALDHLRRMRRRPVTAASSEVELSSWVAPDDTEGSAIEAAATGRAIELIASLPPDQAEAVLLRVVLGLDVQTTADVLGKRPGAVRSAAHRGLRRLAAMLGDRDEHAAVARPPLPRTSDGFDE